MEGTTETPPTPQPPAGPPTPGPVWPRLVRSRSDRKLAGVAGGLASYLRIDPLPLRIAFVVLSFVGGLGILLYLVGWALIPEEGSQAALGDGVFERLRRAPAWVPVTLLVIVGLFFVGKAWGAPVFVALLLIGAGVWLYHNDTHHPAATSPPPPPPPAPPSDAPTAPLAAIGTWPSYQPPPSPAPYPPAPYVPRPRRPRSQLGRYTLAAGLVVLGLVAAGDNIGAFHVPARIYPALALLVVGCGLLVGSVFGRSRMLILVGLLVLPFAFAASVVRVPIARGAGERLYAPQAAGDVRSGYDLGAGQLHLDLTQTQWGTAPVKTRLRVATGEILVDVPSDVTVEFHGHAGAGDIMFLGQNRNGVGSDLDAVALGAANAPRLILGAEVSLGQIQVDRSDTPARTAATQGPAPSPIPVTSTAG